MSAVYQDSLTNLLTLDPYSASSTQAHASNHSKDTPRLQKPKEGDSQALKDYRHEDDGWRKFLVVGTEKQDTKGAPDAGCSSPTIEKYFRHCFAGENKDGEEKGEDKEEKKKSSITLAFLREQGK